MNGPFVKKNARRRRRTGVDAAAKVLLSITNPVVRPEIFYSSSVIDTHPLLFGELHHLNRVSRGFGQSFRYKDTYKMKTLLIRGKVRFQGGSPPACVLLYIVYDKAPNLVLPAVTDIFEPLSGTSYLQDNFQVEDTMDRFVVLKRQKFLMGVLSAPAVNGWSADGTRSEWVEYYINLDDLRCRMIDAGGDIDSCVEGGLYCVLYGQTGAGLNCHVDLRTRLYFGE